ncbi:MAG: DNA polymerase III subunit epsilon [Gammaproteobacteria bacterium]|nr:MAG: DNA polymerase III subunit epsilon [Gammaproteobacteria bacterium]
MRQVVLDTETTGLDPAEGHRIIEIGCVELVDRRPTRRTFHVYLQPDREIDEGAVEVHGITNEFLQDKPRFADIVDEFLAFVEGAELIIHNAPFDVGFLNHELALLGEDRGRIEDHCRILDTLALARRMHPGQRNSLDALCKRYGVDNSGRELHGALLDAEILADVYLAMTGGQASLLPVEEAEASGGGAEAVPDRIRDKPPLRVIRASAEEAAAHAAFLAAMRAAGHEPLWKDEDEGT